MTEIERMRLTLELEQFIQKQGFTNGILFCTNNEDARILIVNPGNKLNLKTAVTMSELVEWMQEKAKAHLNSVHTYGKAGDFDTKQDF